MAGIRISNLGKVFADGTVALSGFSLDIEDREFLTFLGPSGCGKTTTLRMIAGLEQPTAGSIYFGSRRVDHLDPSDRNVAMVFQSYALYPNMTVRQNLEYPLRKRRVPPLSRAARVAETAAVLKIEGLLDRRPRQLSGGQQHRVALGRAMVRDCDVFLLDEPLSNLDAELRAHMRAELIQLHRRLGRTMVYVTHDQLEAMTMSTRIAVLSHGRLQQVASPDDIYHAPANRFVASFVGSPAMNFLDGDLTVRDGSVGFRAPGLTVTLPPARLSELRAMPAKGIVAGIRPEDVVLGRGSDKASVQVVERTGHEALIWLDARGLRLVARAPAASSVRAGEIVSFTAKPERVHLFGEGSGERLIGRC